MKSLSADEARQLLENARWKVVECARRTDLSLPPKTGHVDYVGRDERGGARHQHDAQFTPAHHDVRERELGRVAAQPDHNPSLPHPP